MTNVVHVGKDVGNAPKPNEFFIINRDYNAPLHGVEFVNEDKLRPADQAFVRPDAGGFPAFAELPFFRETLPGHTLKDFNSSFEGYWLVSEGLKEVLESVDPEGLEFSPTRFIQADGSEGGKFFLCDVSRSLDAVDEDASDLRIITEGFPKGKFYRVAGGASLAFKREVVAGAHIFRLEFNDALIVCDRRMRDALIERGYGAIGQDSGMAIQDAADY